MYTISWRVRSSFIFAFDYLNQADNVRININVDKLGQWDVLLKDVFMLWLSFLHRYTRLIYQLCLLVKYISYILWEPSRNFNTSILSGVNVSVLMICHYLYVKQIVEGTKRVSKSRKSKDLAIKWQKYKQLSTKHCTEKKILCVTVTVQSVSIQVENISQAIPFKMSFHQSSINRA